MKQRCAIIVKGNHHTWSFHFDAKPEYIQDWRDDGLEIDEIYYAIPAWVVNLGLTRPWMFFEDLLYFRNPFAKH